MLGKCEITKQAGRTGKLAWQTDNKGLAALDIVDDRPLLRLVVGQVVLSILSLN